MGPEEEQSSHFGQGAYQHWVHMFCTLFFFFSFASTPRILSFSDEQCCIIFTVLCNLPEQHDMLCQKTSYVSVELILGLVFSIFCWGKKKPQPQTNKEKTKQTIAMFLCFPQQVFSNTLAQTVCPMTLFWTDLWGLKLLGVLRPLPLPAIISSWNASCAKVKISSRQCWETGQWKLIQCLHWKLDFSWKVYL